MHISRNQRSRALLREAGIDALAIVPGANLRYLTGMALYPSERLTLLLLAADGSASVMVLPAMDAARARTAIQSTEGRNATVHFYIWNDAEGPTDALRQAVAHLFRAGATSSAPTLAVEHTAMRVFELRALQDALPGLRTVDAAPLLAPLRMVKDQDELAAMAQAVVMIETALRETLPHIKPGVSERQIAALWSQQIMAAGAERESFPCMVASGPNSANPHHHNSERALEAGDLIILDGGAVAGGYASDITRTVALGTPSPQASTIYNLVLAANSAGRAAVGPGTTGEAIDQATRHVISSGGYGDFFLHRTGHGLGLECHELPNIVAGSTQPLPVGTTFTIEPGIYIAGVAGVRIEDDMVVTENGGRSLTTFERDLLVLPT